MCPRVNGLRGLFGEDAYGTNRLIGQRDMFALPSKKRAGEVREHFAGSHHNHPLERKGPVMATSDSIVAPAALKPAASSRKQRLDVGAELSALRKMTPAELREKYAEVYGEGSRSGHKEWLIKRIIWRMQANAEGDLSERARQRALEIANDADLRLQAPRPSRRPPAAGPARVAAPAPVEGVDRLGMPGGTITRDYKGKHIEVRVLENGLEYDGQTYKTLSAVAKAITGSHTNGYLFFRLGKYGGAR